MPAEVPGTVAAALPRVSNAELDGCDWWFRAPLAAAAAADDELLVLELGGIATLAEVFLDGERVLRSESMFAAHELVLEGAPTAGCELVICCRALAPALAQRRRPRARWRTKLVADGNLRFWRTMLLGRCPGFAPEPAAVGPWRPVALARRRGCDVRRLSLRPRLERDGTGVLELEAELLPLPAGAPVRAAAVALERGGRRFEAELALGAGPAGAIVRAHGALALAGAERWWPHTHGEPALYAVALVVEVAGERIELDAGCIGFRALDPGADPERDGLALRINEVPVFARGAVWTPLELARPHSAGAALRERLELVRDGGMNMLRVVGTACYESEEFHALCDELGILVWQDFMLANLDYPQGDPAFLAAIEREGRELLARLQGRPSVAVVCGGSEVFQQVAMLGLDPEQLAARPLYRELLPRLVREAGLDAAYLPSAPCGGERPFQPDRGVANYFGVGGYRRPLSDARLAEVRFAAECLALANVPDDEALAALEAPGGLAAHHPAYKAGVPRDAGAGWDFEDVRDHYLQRLYGLDPVALRSLDHERYLELSRLISGELMAAVFGEWRRQRSPCAGGLVLWLGDLRPGSGWGLLDHRGRPKLAYHLLRQRLAPVSVWMCDEGLAGISVHVANDRPAPLQARLRLAVYREQETLVAEAARELELPPHGGAELDAEALLGRFLDLSWAYRFGQPQHDLIAASLEPAQGPAEAAPLAQAFAQPPGWLPRRETPAQLGLAVSASGGAEPRLRLQARRFVRALRLSLPGYRWPLEGASLEPGRALEAPLDPLGAAGEQPTGSLSALNLAGSVAFSLVG